MLTVPFAVMVISWLMVSVNDFIARMPLVPPPITRLLQEAVLSSVTVDPSVMMTSSDADGTFPPTQVDPEFQFPPVPVEDIALVGESPAVSFPLPCAVTMRAMARIILVNRNVLMGQFMVLVC